MCFLNIEDLWIAIMDGILDGASNKNRDLTASRAFGTELQSLLALFSCEAIKCHFL